MSALSKDPNLLSIFNFQKHSIYRHATIVFLYLFMALTSDLLAVGDASTHFQLFVPPNNNASGRDVALIVTNCSPFDTIVNIIDTDEDGDSDDSVSDILLTRGQSYVRYIKDGAVNDDAGGKWDGDYFIVTSQDPVVLQMSTKSDWQWDFVPAENKTMRGQSFFIYSPSTSFSQRDVNLVAYEDQTEIYVLDITQSPVDHTGTTSVNLENPLEVLKTTLDEGEDLIGRNGLGKDILDPGHTYWIRASKGVTCQYGSLDKNARDGGGFVPSSNGFSSGSLFYFYIPRDYGNERELRIISFNDENLVEFSGWNKDQKIWELINTYSMDAFNHEDWVENGTDYPMYQVRCSEGKKVALFAASWLEAKGLSGTKDIASFASSEQGYGAGKEFLVYIPQPGYQNNVVINGERLNSHSHVFLFGHVEGTNYTVVDADTDGQLFNRSGVINKDGYTDIRMSPTEFKTLNKPSIGRRPYLKISADHLVTALITNFNDNWMTYTPSAVLPNPLLEVTVDSPTVQVGVSSCFQFTATNDGAGPLQEGLLEIALDPGSSYESSIFSPPLGEPDLSVDEATGGQILTWDGFSIPALNSLEGTICQTPSARRPDNTPLKNGDFLINTVLIRGSGFALPEIQGGEFETFVAQHSMVLTVDDQAQTRLESFTVQTEGAEVLLSWETQREPDLAGFHLFRSTSPDSGYQQITTELIAARGDAISGDIYTHADSPSSPNRDYYYKLVLVDDQDVSSTFGPVSAYPIDITGPDTPELVTITPGDSTAILSISGGNRDGDLAGYWIYRSSLVDGTYNKINRYLHRNSQRYDDNSLGNGKTYYYKVRAQDLYGNRSSLSPFKAVTLGNQVDSLYTVAYEDQTGPGKNDWDYNDWVVQISSTERFNNGGLTSVEINLESMARGARWKNAFFLRVRAMGPWTAQLDIYNDRDETQPLSSTPLQGVDDITLELFSDTVEALPPDEGDDFTNTLNRQSPGKLGRVAHVSITFESPQDNFSADRHFAPFDPYLSSQVGEIHSWKEGFPDSTEVVTFWPESPLFGYNLDYVLAVPSFQWRWPLENQKIWNAYPELFSPFILSGRVDDLDWHLPEQRDTKYTYEWHPALPSTSSKSEGPREAIHEEKQEEVWASFSTPFVASPMLLTETIETQTSNTLLFTNATGSVLKIDKNGESIPGWPININSNRCTPAIARLSPQDTTLTLVTGEERYDDQAKIQVWSLEDPPQLRWERPVLHSIKSPPVIADLDGDAQKEILAITSDGDLYIYHSDGSPYENTPISLGDSQWNDKNILVTASPVVFDTDGDGKMEIFALTPMGTTIWGFNHDLTERLGWPKEITSPLTSGLSLGRDGNGYPAIFGAAQNGTLFAWNTYGQPLPNFPVNLEASVLSRVVIFDDLMNSTTRITTTDSEGNIYLLDSNGVISEGWPQSSPAGFIASPVVGDMDGDAEPEILTADLEGNVRVWNLDGTLEESFVQSVHGAVQATPLLTDLDNNARLEAYIATAQGDIVRIEGEVESPLTGRYLANFPSFGGLSASHEATMQNTLPPAPALPTNLTQVIGVILGLTPADSKIQIDVNFDGVIDSADVIIFDQLRLDEQ
jgi:LruC domain-containing protein